MISASPTSKGKHVYWRDRALGIVTTHLSDPTHISILEGAQVQAGRLGYPIFISPEVVIPYGEPTNFPFGEWSQLAGVLIIYAGADNDTHTFFKNISANIPIVTTGYAQNHKNVQTIEINRQKGAREATEHLFSLGHRHIAHITGPLESIESRKIRCGYIETLKEVRITPDDRLIVASDGSSAGGYRATLELLNRQVGFSALFVQNDQMAIGALRALHERGMRVPHDLALVGFNDIPLAQYCVPPLTTVHYPFHELGQAAVRLLINLIDHEFIPSGANKLESKLIIRHSCGVQCTSRVAY